MQMVPEEHGKVTPVFSLPGFWNSSHRKEQVLFPGQQHQEWTGEESRKLNFFPYSTDMLSALSEALQDLVENLQHLESLYLGKKSQVLELQSKYWKTMPWCLLTK